MVTRLLWILAVLALVGPVLVWRHGGEEDKTHEDDDSPKESE